MLMYCNRYGFNHIDLCAFKLINIQTPNLRCVLEKYAEVLLSFLQHPFSHIIELQKHCFPSFSFLLEIRVIIAP